MALALVQPGKVNSTAGASVVTWPDAITFDATPQAGCLLVVCLVSYGSETRWNDVDVTDGSGHLFDRAFATNKGTDNQWVGVFYHYCAAGPADATIDWNTQVGYAMISAMAAWEFSGSATSSVEDTAGRNSANDTSGTSTAATAGVSAPGAGNKLYVHCMTRLASGAATLTPTWANALEQETAAYQPLEASYMIGSGNQQETVTIQSGKNWAAMIATFNEGVSAETITTDKWHPALQQPYVPKWEIVDY